MSGLTDTVLLSGINPFDKSYHSPQYIFDRKIIQLIMEILNLNATITQNSLITDLTFYGENPDNWILEQIINGTAEMSSSTIVLTSKLQKAISYTFPIDTFRPQLYYRASSLRENYNIYLLPFSPKLWICLITTAVLLTAILIFILKREEKLPHEISYDVFARLIDVQQDRDEGSPQDFLSTPTEVLLQKEKWEMAEILLVCLGAICQQGSARDPSTSAARILLLVLFILAVVGYTAYSASVISLVSLFPSTDRERIQDLQYFSRQYNTLLFNTNNMENTSLQFKESEFTNLKKGLDKALQGKAVFLGDRDISLTFLHQQNYAASIKCMLGRTSIGMEYSKVFMIHKNFKYKAEINYNILRLREFGLLNREKNRIFKVQSPCSLAEKLSLSNYVSFNKNDVMPVLNFFKLGVVMSIVLLILEKIIFACPKQIFSRSKKPNRKTKNRPNLFIHRNNFIQTKITSKSNFYN